MLTGVPPGCTFGITMIKLTVNVSKMTFAWLERLAKPNGLTPRGAAREVLELVRDPQRPNPLTKPPLPESPR